MRGRNEKKPSLDEVLTMVDYTHEFECTELDVILTEFHGLYVSSFNHKGGKHRVPQTLKNLSKRMCFKFQREFT